MMRRSRRRQTHNHKHQKKSCLSLGEKSRSASQGTSRMAQKNSILRFVLVFCACMAVFYSVALTDAYLVNVLQPYLEVNADISASLLRVLGQDVTSSGRVISSSKVALSIERGCDAIHPTALYLSAVLAFPTSRRRRVLGALAGLTVLLAVNIVRIISLFFVQIHFPSAFEFVHVDIWQALFIFLAMLAWILWANSENRNPVGRLNSEQTT